MQVTVFTTVLGPTKDVLRAPSMVVPGVRYVAITDRPRVPAPYERVPLTAPPSHGRRDAALLSRRLKILADHPALGTPDVVLWHDAAFELRCDPCALAEQSLADVDLVAFRHPDRTRIEDEGAVIVRMGYAPAAVVAEQVATYRAEGWTDQRVITSTGFSLRRMTPSVRAFSALWWAEVERWTWRDQMSVDYALWKTGLRVGYIAGHYRDNPYALWHTESSTTRWRRTLRGQAACV